MKISVITATYNSAKTIRDTVESILSQNCQDWEHIIVDGASKDSTLAIIEEYKDRYKGRLKVLSEPDKGIYDAMNKGIKMAKGDIIGFLNSDDFYYSDKSLLRVQEILKNNIIDAIYSDTLVVDREDINKIILLHDNKYFRRPLMRLGFMPSHPTFYARKEVYEKYGNFDINYKIAEDFDWLFKAT